MVEVCRALMPFQDLTEAPCINDILLIAYMDNAASILNICVFMVLLMLFTTVGRLQRHDAALLSYSWYILTFMFLRQLQILLEANRRVARLPPDCHC